MTRIHFSFNTSCEPEDQSRFLLTLDGTLHEVIDDEDSEEGLKEVQVGVVKLILVQRDRIIDSTGSLFAVMEEHSFETCECYESIFDFETDEWKTAIESLYEPEMLRNDNLLLIEKLEINEEWQGKGIGHSVIREIVSIFGSSCGLICCKPFPLRFVGWQENEETIEQEKEREQAFQRVECFWKSLGFRSVPECDFLVFSPEFDSELGEQE